MRTAEISQPKPDAVRISFFRSRFFFFMCWRPPHGRIRPGSLPCPVCAVLAKTDRRRVGAGACPVKRGLICRNRAIARSHDPARSSRPAVNAGFPPVFCSFFSALFRHRRPRQRQARFCAQRDSLRFRRLLTALGCLGFAQAKPSYCIRSFPALARALFKFNANARVDYA